MARPTRTRFFRDDDFEFSTELVVGAATYRAADLGEALATAGRIRNGDYDSWCGEWRATAERVEAIARDCEGASRRVSAHEAWLRASTYWFQTVFYLLGTKDGTKDDLKATWRRHRDCFESAARLADPPWERVAIPYEETELEGWLFRGRPADERAPLLLLNNGSDGTVTDMWIQGGAAGTERGYNCLAFDGPGQGRALYEQSLYFRPDWEKVVTPVVDYARGRDDVDADRIALLGVSQGGYWVPRALAFEPRIAAGAADPGVVDVSAAMDAHLPAAMRKQIDRGEKEKFDGRIHTAERFIKSLRFTIEYRAFPYGTDSAFEMMSAARSYKLEPEDAARIECPLLITGPEAEQFWPGQSRQLADLVGDNAEVVAFTAEEGAELHCEPLAQGLRSQRIFDWLDEQLG
jgi:alpha-beta hydrolase superfamily lysophospholipase